MKKVGFLVLLVFGLGLTAGAAEWPNKARVLHNAEKLQEQVEILDESLHALDATTEVIEIVHHFEETITEFVTELNNLGYSEARRELDHLREDIFLVYGRLNQVGFFRNGKAIQAWNQVLSTYIVLERSMDNP